MFDFDFVWLVGVVLLCGVFCESCLDVRVIAVELFEYFGTVPVFETSRSLLLVSWLFCVGVYLVWWLLVCVIMVVLHHEGKN